MNSFTVPDRIGREFVALSDEKHDAVPDQIRRAAKAIANQPQLWCRGTLHMWVDENGRRVLQDQATDSTVQQSCALGHIERVLIDDYGAIDGHLVFDAVRNPINAASLEVHGSGLASLNDAADATPASVADAMCEVADKLDFEPWEAYRVKVSHYLFTNLS